MPVYQISAPALLEIQVLGRLHGQRTRNVFHYNFRDQADIADGASKAYALAEQFAVQKWQSIMVELSNEYVCEAVTAQWVKPTRYRQAVFPLNEAGGLTGSSLPSMCAAVLSLYGIQASRSSRGRKYIPGIPITYEDDSMLDGTFLGAMDDLGTALLNPLTIPATSITLPLTIQTPETWNGSPLFELTAVQAQPVIRTQRRRQVGVGE